MRFLTDWDRRIQLLGSMVLASAVLLAQQPAPQESAPQQPIPVFRGEANLVLVDAYPQRNGRIIEGLTAGDFELYEDGKLQTIRNLEFVRVDGNEPEAARRDPNNLPEMMAMAADPHNRVFVAYLDTLQTTVEGSQRIRVPLVQTLNRMIGPDDLFGVMTPAMRPRDVTFARRLLSTEDQLSRYWAWGARNGVVPTDAAENGLTSCFQFRFAKEQGGQSVPWTVAGDNRTLDLIVIERRREDRALQGLEDLVPRLGAMREARSVVLLVTDGFALFTPNQALTNEPARDMRATLQFAGGRLENGDFSSCTSELNRLALLDNRQRYRDLITAAQRANVSFYPIAPNGLAVFDVGAASERVGQERSLADNYTRMRDRVQSLTTIAENTDGIATVNRNDVAEGLKKVIDDLSAYYLLGYYSTNEKSDGRYRKIEVKLKQPGVTVHARRGYVAQPATVAAVGAPTGTRAAAAPSAGITDALSVLGKVRPDADLYSYGAVLSASDLRLVVELASKHVETAAWRSGGVVNVDVRSASGARLTSAKGTIEAGTRAVSLTIPVSSTGPVVVRATASAGDALLEADPVTVQPVAGRLGTPLVFRAAASPRAPLKPMADLQLRRTERIHVEWPISGSTDNRSVRLLTKLGQPLTADINVSERTLDGKPQLAVDLGLAALGEGEYVIALEATVGGTTDRQWLGFRVVK